MTICLIGHSVANFVGNIVGHIVGLIVGNIVGHIVGLIVSHLVGHFVAHFVGHLSGLTMLPMEVRADNLLMQDCRCQELEAPVARSSAL